MKLIKHAAIKIKAPLVCSGIFFFLVTHGFFAALVLFCLLLLLLLFSSAAANLRTDLPADCRAGLALGPVGSKCCHWALKGSRGVAESGSGLGGKGP